MCLLLSHEALFFKLVFCNSSSREEYIFNAPSNQASFRLSLFEYGTESLLLYFVLACATFLLLSVRKQLFVPPLLSFISVLHYFLMCI